MTQLHHVYYFLRPPPAAAARAAALQEAMRRCCPGARTAPMPPERLHITLQPLGRFEGRVPDEARDLWLAAGKEMDEEPFDAVFNLVLCGAGRDAVGTLQLRGRGPAQRRLRRFQRSLGEVLCRQGFPAADLRTRFMPHMTLDYAHPRVAPQSLDTPIAWQVTHLYLVDSLYGRGRHEVLGCWPLRQRQQTFSDRLP